MVQDIDADGDTGGPGPSASAIGPALAQISIANQLESAWGEDLGIGFGGRSRRLEACFVQYTLGMGKGREKMRYFGFEMSMGNVARPSGCETLLIVR